MYTETWTTERYNRAASHRLMVREPLSDYSFPYTERHLQCVWFDSTLRPASLQTPEGDIATIESPGRWNLEAGPDFLDAVLIVNPGQRRICGDVEIHIHPEDWFNHKHDRDERYSNVIAHVTYFPSTLNSKPPLPGLLSINLKQTLSRMPGFSMESIDTTAYPYSTPTTSKAPCRKALAKHDVEYTYTLLEAAGRARLQNKTRRAEFSISEKGTTQAFYEEIMRALGYKNNRNAFQHLAEVLPCETLNSLSDGNTIQAYSLLLGVSGLLPERNSYPANEESRAFLRQLWDHWWKMESSLSSKIMLRSTWRLDGQRPHNHPLRRLAAAAALFTCTPDILTSIKTLDRSSPKQWYKQSTNLLQATASMPYWDYRLGFDAERQPKRTRLIGKERAAAIITNAIIPYLAAEDIDTTGLIDNLPHEQNNSVIRQAASALMGNDHNPAHYKTGLRQQGLIQIFHDFCLNSRNGCEECRLINHLP